jgi:hypothetical protein
MRHFTIILVVLNFSNCGFSLILYLPFVLLRQKLGVFFVLNQKCISKPVKCFFVPEWPNWEFVSILCWQHSS